MARLQLLIPLILWATWLGGPPEMRALGVVEPAWGLAIFFLSLVAIVLFARRRARRAMEQTTAGHNAALSRYHLTLFVLRWLLLAVNAAALFLFGWGDVVFAMCGPLVYQVETLPAILSILPVVIAWVGLSWAQYPLDRAVREQNVLFAFDTEQPFHAIPSLGAYLSNAVRTNVLVTLVPFAAVMLLRDATHFSLARTHLVSDATAGWVTALLPIGLVVLFAPELLRRIFPTESLPASPLRDRLELMCRRLRLRYRDILLWHTHHAIGNAAVMGLVPQVRYVLLSDLILETMSERQIEAVFAHEAGHVKHHHLTWFAVFTITALILVELLGVGVQQIWPASAPAWLPMDAVVMVVWLVLFFFALGALSRQFERQADLFAARSVAAADAPAPDSDLPALSPTHGADVFNSALIHVARINNMPLDAGTFHPRGWRIRRWIGQFVHHVTAWRHGSIRSRIVHLQELTLDENRSRRFERRMVVLRVVLLIALLASAAWAVESRMWQQ